MGRDSKKQLIYAGITPFPNGLASTNRLVGLLCELPRYSWQVKVFCLASAKYATFTSNGYAYKRTGIFKGVKCIYLSPLIKYHPYRFLRVFSIFVAHFLLPFFILRHSCKKCEVKIYLVNSTKLVTVLFHKIISSIYGYKYILLSSEYPRNMIKNDSYEISLFARTRHRLMYRQFDGFAIMTFALKDYINRLLNKNINIKIIPMTVDTSRFTAMQNKLYKFEYIAYAGSLSNKKDGVDILLSVFTQIAKKHESINLVIIGSDSSNQIPKELITFKECQDINVQKRIHFTGRINSIEIPTYLVNAKLLVLARPDSIQARGGFPTKLGEYLATGKPVVTTSVGEIPLYLENNNNAILCKPGDEESCFTAIDWVLTNYQEALEIGKKGRMTAETKFNSKINAKKLNEFLLSLK